MPCCCEGSAIPLLSKVEVDLPGVGGPGGRRTAAGRARGLGCQAAGRRGGAARRAAARHSGRERSAAAA